MSRTETTTQRKRRLEKMRRKKMEKLNNEDIQTKKARLETRRRCFSLMVASETVEEKEARLMRYKMCKSQRLQNELPEQREARLEHDRLYHAQIRATETLQQRETRLEKRRVTYSQASAQLNTHLKIFYDTINKFCDKICEVCTKRCYPNQVATCRPSVAAESYLPDELKQKSILLLCHRCKTHITSNKRTCPSKAYWNCLDPGVQPDILKQLSQCEQRLLSRIMPFVKIFKFDGQFGQYGFRGQAVLFAQDIFEISDKLPDMLPRSSSNAGIVIVTEHLVDLNIIREFSISREKVYDALKWLIHNNPLYKDVKIDKNVRMNVEDLARVFEKPQQQLNEVINQEHHFYKRINEVSRIVRASWSQDNRDVFTSGYAGVQCCAMTLANIVRAFIYPPTNWSSNTLDMNLSLIHI